VLHHGTHSRKQKLYTHHINIYLHTLIYKSYLFIYLFCGTKFELRALHLLGDSALPDPFCIFVIFWTGFYTFPWGLPGPLTYAVILLPTPPTYPYVPPLPVCLLRWGLTNFLPRLGWDLQSSRSRVAGIIRVSHHTWPRK
jgi:hypothetical protein